MLAWRRGNDTGGSVLTAGERIMITKYEQWSALHAHFRMVTLSDLYPKFSKVI